MTSCTSFFYCAHSIVCTVRSTAVARGMSQGSGCSRPSACLSPPLSPPLHIAVSTPAHGHVPTAVALQVGDDPYTRVPITRGMLSGVLDVPFVVVVDVVVCAFFFVHNEAQQPIGARGPLTRCCCLPSSMMTGLCGTALPYPSCSVLFCARPCCRRVRTPLSFDSYAFVQSSFYEDDPGITKRLLQYPPSGVAVERVHHRPHAPVSWLYDKVTLAVQRVLCVLGGYAPLFVTGHACNGSLSEFWWTRVLSPRLLKEVMRQHDAFVNDGNVYAQVGSYFRFKNRDERGKSHGETVARGGPSTPAPVTHGYLFSSLGVNC